MSQVHEDIHPTEPGAAEDLDILIASDLLHLALADDFKDIGFGGLLLFVFEISFINNRLDLS